LTRVLITCPPMLKQLERFAADFAGYGWEVTQAQVTQTLTEAQLIELLPQHEGWIIGDDPATRVVLEAGLAGAFRTAVKWGVGTDNVDLAACAELNIPLTNTPAMFGDEVADVALGYTIGLARELFVIDRSVRAGDWVKPSGVSLRDKVFGLVGYGDIGQNLAKRLVACGMRVVVFDPALPTNHKLPDGMVLGRWPAQVEALDFIGFTCALTPGNRHMLNAQVLAQCKTGVRIINVARGPLIDERALIDALESGQVTACALDGSNTIEAVVRTSNRAMQLLDRQLRDQRSGDDR